MSKKTVLEMFKDIKELETADGTSITVEDTLPFFCKSVDNALQRLEAIDNANPSEALECFKHLKRNIMLVDDSYAVKKDYPIIEQALLKAQEQEKALKIIKKKKVNINLLYASSGVEQYNDELIRVYGMWFVKNWLLTEEEFDLLKRYCNES